MRVVLVDSMGNGEGEASTNSANDSGPVGAADRPQASFWDVLKASTSGDKQDYRHSFRTFLAQPCLRESVGWGLGIGALFAVHRFKQDSTWVPAHAPSPCWVAERVCRIQRKACFHGPRGCLGPQTRIWHGWR